MPSTAFGTTDSCGGKECSFKGAVLAQCKSTDGDSAFIEGSLEVKLPTVCRDGKAEVGRVSEEKSRSEKIRDGESQKREDAGARKGRKVAIHCVFSNDLGLRRVEN